MGYGRKPERNLSTVLKRVRFLFFFFFFERLSPALKLLSEIREILVFTSDHSHQVLRNTDEQR